jgi:hypothetical protein
MYSYSLNALIVFYEVVTLLDSFPWADDLLFMTQSGVSNHVAQLEAQTGTRVTMKKKLSQIAIKALFGSTFN